MLFSHTIIPRYQETDQMGIVHHSVYPIWYEEGRVRFCDAIGLPFDKIEAMGLYHAMIELNVKYIKPALFNQRLTLVTTIAGLTKARLTFKYSLTNEANELLNEGETVLVWLNQNLKPINISKSYPELYAMLLNHLETH